MAENISFLTVDDDKTTLDILEKAIRKACPDSDIYQERDGLDAWNTIQQKKPDIVISDLNMPKINGFQLLGRIKSRNELKESFVLMLSSDKESEKEIFNLGADEIIYKPLDRNRLNSTLRSAVKIARLQRKNAEINDLLIQLADELEKDIEDMLKFSVKFLQARIPTSYDMLKKVSKASSWIAAEIGEFEESEIKDIEIAAYLCQIGKVFLPDDLLKSLVQIDGQASHKLMYQVPNTAKEIISSVRRFKDSASILYHMFENFDGSGFPSRLQSWQIPLGSRIIRVAYDYESIRSATQKKPKEVISDLTNRAKKLYDHRVVVLMEQYIRSVMKDEFDPNSYAVQLQELEAGMFLSQDIITNTGLKLIPAGAVLTEKTIDRVLSHNTTDPILGKIYIKKV